MYSSTRRGRRRHRKRTILRLLAMLGVYATVLYGGAAWAATLTPFSTVEALRIFVVLTLILGLQMFLGQE